MTLARTWSSLVRDPLSVIAARTLEAVETRLSRSEAAEADERGTLLLDTLIAMGILAIVFALVAPNYAYARSQSQVGTSANQMSSIATALEMYANDHNGTYPTATAATVAPALFAAAGANTNPYLSTTPLASESNAPYTVTTVAAGAAQATFTITDPSTYPSTLLDGYNTVAGAQCTTCTHLYWSNQSGAYGG